VTVISIAQYFSQIQGEGAFEPKDLGLNDLGLKDLRAEEAPSLRSLDPKEAEELARKLEEAMAAGREEGRASAAADFAVELEQQRRELEGQIAAARQAWLAEEGERLSAAHAAALSQLQSEIADGVARILKPFLVLSLRDQVLDALSETMRTVLKDDKPLLKVSGPEDLLEALRERMGQDEASISYEAAPAVEVSVVADHTVIETRLKAWIDRFDAATE
jgi:flagellar biosynthesis/type III secretory pathway protein FliH